MRKLFLFLAILLISMTGVVFYSCSKDDAGCESCENNDFSMLKTSIIGKEFNLRDYKSQNGGHYMYTVEQNLLDLQHVFEFLKLKGVDVDFSKVGTFVAYTDKPVGMSTFELNLEDIKAVVFYIDTNNGRDMLFKAFVLIDGKYIAQDYLEGFPTRISTNDIKDVARILFDEVVSKICFYNFSNVPHHGDHNNRFSRKIRSLMPKNSSILKSGSGCSGDRLCPDGTGDCFSDLNPADPTGPEVHSCNPIDNGICPLDDAEDNINNQDEQQDPDYSYVQKYNFPQISADLYSFRDNYLKVQSGGSDVIALYYGFTDKIDFTMFSWDLSVETFDLISDVVVPMTKELEADPYSQTKILIDTQESLRLNTYLDKVKLTMKDQPSKDNIDAIKIKLNDYTNKPHKYITDNL